MRKPRLMTPGPAMVPEDVLLELARPVIHHRSDEAKQVIVEVAEGLKEVFQTKNDVMILTSSGTGAMEAAVVNVIPPGGKALVLNAGHFAARWGSICKAFGVEAVMIDTEWGKPVDPDQVAQALKQHPDAVAVLGTLSETSTGTGHPVEAIGKIVADSQAVYIVDGISGVGAMECRTDEWGIDVLCAGSQKALMLPPGLAFISLSAKAWAKVDAFDSHSFYFNLKAARSKAKEFDTPYTPAHTLILALRTALKRIRAEGIENVWSRHKVMSEACQAGVQALGLELFSARPAEGLTAFRVPEGLKDSQIRNKMAERFGVTTVGGQAKLKGKIVRIGHMGYTDELDVVAALAALEMTLAELGFEVEPGKAVTAAQQVLIGKGATALA
ncbi:pyridoxal-phosphate-dependent aminotransferase family protein [Planctomyces sp. SH-PL62]|uniref:pyridoxal-phosphate-dependent aminotransferase family protein n=1 Tax=Planctomyces sp. SH-PL62 TaxID=1636152 RepID=UPI00078D01B0|nr:alanine--glyoxylate aminotransferase family protein [Planctomyces sp. SH-PL62]AMV38256.1 Soluble hydrogenase 42 kDa subunit [Planctomyces sp. SH-PL62]